MNILIEYNLKTQINLIFVLTGLPNFIKNYPLQDNDYFKARNRNFIILFDTSDNLPLVNFLVNFIKMNKKRNIIADAI